MKVIALKKPFAHPQNQKISCVMIVITAAKG